MHLIFIHLPVNKVWWIDFSVLNGKMKMRWPPVLVDCKTNRCLDACALHYRLDARVILCLCGIFYLHFFLFCCSVCCWCSISFYLIQIPLLSEFCIFHIFFHFSVFQSLVEMGNLCFLLALYYNLCSYNIQLFLFIIMKQSSTLLQNTSCREMGIFRNKYYLTNRHACYWLLSFHILQ